MQIHNLKRTHKNKKDRLIGRGGKHAKTSGRGGKGQTARAGNKRRPELRDIIKKLPKLRGYRTPSFEIKPKAISLDIIAKKFKAGEVVSAESLLKNKIISKVKGRVPKVKVLDGKADFSLKLEFVGCSVSASAKAKIVKAGGEVK